MLDVIIRSIVSCVSTAAEVKGRSRIGGPRFAGDIGAAILPGGLRARESCGESWSMLEDKLIREPGEGARGGGGSGHGGGLRGAHGKGSRVGEGWLEVSGT